MVELLERIESQLSATRLPLVAITVAAVPCPDTPVIMTLHWHGFLKGKLIDADDAQPVRFTSVPSSALQLNDRWNDLRDLDLATMEAGWELGAWDVARAELPSCMRPGAPTQEAMDCLKAFGQFPWGVDGNHVVVSDAPDADDLVAAAARRGYLMWTFRPVHGGIWGEVADDVTLRADGTREAPCPVECLPPTVDRTRRTVYRFGRSAGPIVAH